MKRTLFFITLLFAVLLCRTPTAEGALTYGADYYRQNKQRVLSPNYNVDPIWLALNEIDTTIAGTSGVTSILFTPGTAPTASKGVLYYDLASEALLLYNGSNWVTIDTAGGTSLDGSYNLGNTIDVDGSAVTLTTSNADNNVVLAIVQNEADNDNDAVTITMGTNAVGSGLLINSQTGGTDITGDNWSVAQTGVITSVSTIVGSAGLVGTQADIINNETDNTWTFDSDTATTEDFSIGLGANTNIITFSSASAAATIDFGDINTLTGMTTITGDAADFTIGSTGNATGEDVIIQQAGTGDNQLTLQSAGSGANALTLLASAAGIDMDATGSTIVMTNTSDGSADDFTIEVAGATDSSLILQSAGTGGDAVSLISSAATGDIKIGSADMIDIDAADDILIDIAGAAGEDFLLTNTGGSITLTATEAAADAIVLSASTALGGIDITSNADIDITTTGTAAEDITISNTGGTVIISASEDVTDALDLNATAGGIDIDATGDAGQDIVVTNTGGSINLSASEDATDAINIDATAGGIDIDATGEAGQDIIVTNTGGSISLVATEGAADAIVLNASTAVGGIDITSNADIDITTTGAATEDISITNTGGSIIVTATENVQNGIHIEANGGTSESINLYANQGTGASATTEHDASIQLQSDAGGISLYTTGDVADAIRLEANAGTSETIAISSVQGTGTSSIDIDSTVGGITIATNAAGKDVDIDSVLGAINIEAEEDGAEAILIVADGGTSTTLKIHNDTGTSVTEGAGSIEILSDAGGVEIKSTANLAKAVQIITDAGTTESIYIQADQGTAASAATESDAAIQLVADVGGIGLRSGLNNTDAIRLEADGGTSEIIILHSNQGTGAAATTQSDASIQLLSDVGGIALVSGLNGADSVRIEANGGANETVAISSVQGTGAASIDIDSTVGGVTIAANAAGKDVDIDSVLGSILIEAEEDSATAISIISDGDTASGIWIQNDTGTSVTEDTASVEIRSDVGGINIQSDADLDDALMIRVDGGTTSEMTIHNDQGSAEDSIEIVSDAGGIDITCATAKNMDLTGGQIALLSNEAAAGAIALTTNTGAAETIVITNTQGTDEAAIDFVATAGGITFTTSGDTKFENDIDVDAAIVGDGLAAFSGMLDTVTDDTDGKVLTVAETGTVQTNAGAGGAAAWTLPGAAAGLRYTFVVMAAFELRVTPAGGDKIYYGSTAMAAAEYYYADAVGESLILEAVDGTNWIVLSSTGTWAEQTP